MNRSRCEQIIVAQPRFTPAGGCPPRVQVTIPKKNMDSRIMGTFRNGHFLSAWILLWVWMTTVPSSMWSILKRGLQLSFSYQVCQNRMKRSQVIGSSVQEF